MAISFTPQQQKVIDLHHRNILVSAAAGSGKTAVLVERIIRMICSEEQPVDIDRLLIVTFTNAAAAEMRERISLGVSRELALHPQSDHIQRQAALLHNAQITTIDSFCMFLLKNHFHEIGMDPAFRVMDEGEKRLLEQEVMEGLFEDKFAEKYKGKEVGAEQTGETETPTAFENCVEYFCPGGSPVTGEKLLEGYIQSLNRFAESFPWPEEWLAARRKDYAPCRPEELGETDFGRYLTAHIRKMLEGCQEVYRQIVSLCHEPDGPYMYGELADRELEQLEHLLKLEKLEDYGVWLPAFVFGRLSSKKDETVSGAKRELAKNLRARVKAILTDLAARFFTTPLPLAAKQMGACAEAVETLVDLVLEYRRRLKERKWADKLVDFSDLEHYALEILLDREGEEVRPSQVALEYRQHFAEILIDEYQDSNLVQEYLLSAISGEEDGNYNRFMVGDVKQSIYKFRLARPELFLEKYDAYTEEDGSCQRIDLSRNFRSRREVVDTVNGIFRGIMSRQTGGIDYDDRAALYAGASYPENHGCESELLLVEKPRQEDPVPADCSEEKGGSGEETSGKSLTARQAEALAIAARIKELMDGFLVTDKESGQLRPVQFRDIVILLRTASGWDEEFQKILEQEGIPTYITSKTGYFAASEVQDLLQLLRVLDNPRQEIPLFGVMKSFFGGFSEEEIALIRSRDKERCLAEVLESLSGKNWEGFEGGDTDSENPDSENPDSRNSDSGNPESENPGSSAEADVSPALREKIAGFLTKIRRFRRMTVYMPIRELLQQIAGETGYLDYVTALPAGSKRRANVEMLFTKASDFEKTSYHGLFHFVRYIEQLEKYDVDFGEAALLDENADVVRIMSIHKSKGLEFPVTFVSGLSKRFNMQDTSQSMIVDMDMGIGTDYVDAEKRIRNKTLRRLALARKMREDSLSEELRVLYVALTRPREKLIMTGVLENAAAKWEEQQYGTGSLPYPDFMESGCYLDFLLPVAGNAGVDVRILNAGEFSVNDQREQVRLMEKRQRLLRPEKYADQNALAGLGQRFAWQYPLGMLRRLYTKTTVSELKFAALEEKDEAAFHLFEEKEIVPYIPRFMRTKEEPGGAARGNAFHKAMQLIDFHTLYRGIFSELPREKSVFQEAFGRGQQGRSLVSHDSHASCTSHAVLRKNLQDQLDALLAAGRLSEEYRKTVNEYKMTAFFESELAWRMWRAADRGQLHREQPFVYGVSAGRLDPEFPEEETVLIQGIVDAYFIEEGQLVIVDYKTDAVETPQELWNRYEVQLKYYEEALCRLTALPVKQKILYSFYLEKCVEGV